ncbi:MAG: dihydropteroate synthase, partial [Spirochaetales bacterium]|nr:dihydropteroate synthase [Spirochaetales bacterium]
VMAMGGCCGTTPAFIKALSEMVAKSAIKGRKTRAKTVGCVCSSSTLVRFDKLNVIGERINPTGKKKLKEALLSHDMNHIMELAIKQTDAGADILDINVGVPGIDEEKMMKDVVQAVQGVVQIPLMIDSSNAKAIEAGLRYANGKAIVNSVNANDEKLDEILPIAAKYGAAVVGLTMDRKLPSSVSERIEYAKKIRDRAVKAGIRRSDIIIDCLTLTVSAQQDQTLKTLEAVRQVRNRLGLHATLGVSNIAFGLPEKTHVTESFLTLALGAGLDLPIINPNSQIIMDAIASFRALSGEDKDSKAYIERFAALTEQPKVKSTIEGMGLEDAILKGLGKETEKATEELLESMEPMDVINKKLIPALDLVGEKYEKHEIFLPQLINAANAAGCGFDIIKKNLPKKSGSSNGKIIIATVEGDIHDIGKNIVKVVLENYGYNVIDLGKDVPVQTVVERTISEDAHLVALSALMTTTVESMKRTIEALRQSGHVCKVMVGGAVLTTEYAKMIGADYYTKDPKQSADTAREVLG